MNWMESIGAACDFLRSKGIKEAEVGIVLGTGLGKLSSEIQNSLVIDYEDIPHFPTSTVEFHAGKLFYGSLLGKKVIALQGRFHYYEGYTMQEVVFPIRVLKALGIKYLLMSGAAGTMRLDWKKGDLMMITDHINLLPDNPLRGTNLDALGPRFPDMSEAYSKQINGVIRGAAQNLNLTLREGIYASVQGPNLETAAEYRFLKTIGADAVGMSTVPEVIAANHTGLPCASVVVLTDECDPDDLKPVDIPDIIAVATKAEQSLIELYKLVVAKI